VVGHFVFLNLMNVNGADWEWHTIQNYDVLGYFVELNWVGLLSSLKPDSGRARWTIRNTWFPFFLPLIKYFPSPFVFDFWALRPQCLWVGEKTYLHVRTSLQLPLFPRGGSQWEPSSVSAGAVSVEGWCHVPTMPYDWLTVGWRERVLWNLTGQLTG
jgi:hypothetical protein